MTIVIPTRLDRTSIYPLVETANAIDDVVLVYTEPGLRPIPGVEIVTNYERNIQSWWNTGLDHSGEKALILNDDIIAQPEDLLDMLDQLEVSDLVYTNGRPHDHKSPLSGWAWGLRPDKIRLDTDFVWWYGEDDLYRRAERDGLRITMVPTGIQHMPRSSLFTDMGLANASIDDGILFRQRWES